MQELSGFNNDETVRIALGAVGDENLPIRFHVVEKMNKVKSEGGLVRFDRWKDHENIDRLKSELEALGIEYSVRENDRDDTIDVRVKGAGRPIYDQVDYIEIRAPGDKTQINDFPVNKTYRQRFSRQYEAWKAGRSQHLSGTSLTQWPGVTRSQAEEFANHGIHTVEQLAAVPDGNLARMGPVSGLKQRAKDYLEAAKGLSPVNQLRSELADKSNEIETLKRQMQEILAAQAKAAADKVQAQEVKPQQQQKR